MTREGQTRIARRLTVASAMVILVCLTVLLADYVVAARRAPDEKLVVDELVAQVKENAGAATPLHEERERQTVASISRETRSQAVAWILLVAGGVFVAGGKWSMSLRPQELPALEDLVADRFPAARPAAGKSRKTTVTTASEQDDPDISFVDGLVEKLGTGREAAIPILQAIQNHYRHLPDEALTRVCELTEITPAQIAGTSTFYAQFRRSPVGRYVVRVCHGTACHVAGADQITQELRRHLDIPPGEDTDQRRRFTIDSVACLGCCSLAPVMMVEDDTAGHLTPASARQTLDDRAEST